MRFSRRISLLASGLALSMLPVTFAHCSSDGSVVPTADASTPKDSSVNASGLPLVIGHRGASGYRPEHTLAAYRLAIDMGADFIEPDVVSTKDHVLICRHENEIGGTTDVAIKFPERKKIKVLDGKETNGWWTEDFTLAEIKTLRAKERVPDLRPLNTAFDGQEEVPTLKEVIELAKSRGVGIYPETKHPTYFKEAGLALEEEVVKLLDEAGWREPTDPVFLQSFEPGSLQKLKTLTHLRLVQLIDENGKPFDSDKSANGRSWEDLTKPEGLAFIATYAQGIGPSKKWIIPRDAANKLTAPTTLVADAHKAGLIVHAWTFRNENNWLPEDYRGGNPDASTYLQERGDAPGEYRRFFETGLDGVFSDCADTAVATRKKVFGR
ncbi:glycerophosphodiester phosphodiesterase [Pendulispora albinea]|uniref:glycerophosphodiester phosphodiesterase n=1 Tax=Pendulispora albinea TaxID=2741071 RepID=A0ABZ2LSJ5_9BACT